MSFHIQIFDDLTMKVLDGGINPPTDALYIFTLADDFLPPAGYLGKTDTQLKADPTLWPFDYFRKHRKANMNVENIPATVTTLKKGSFTHSVDWIIYWANNLALAWFDTTSYLNLSGNDRDEFNSRWSWVSKGTEVITNGKGKEQGYFDPVLNVNAGATPIGIDSLLMERTVVLPVDSSPRRIGGMSGFLFYTLDGDGTPPLIEDINYRNHPEFFSNANIIMSAQQRDENGNLYPYTPNDHLGLNPFPQGWDLNANTPLPNISVGTSQLPSGQNLVPSNRVALNSDGSLNLVNYIPNPYNPEQTLR